MSARGCRSRSSRTRSPAPPRAPSWRTRCRWPCWRCWRLTPVERAAYLLREAFGYEYAEIAEIIDRTEVNTRQLVTRARKHIEASRPRFDADEAARDALLERFLAAAEEGDLESLEELLAKDAVLYADGGGKAIAAQEPRFGAALIARYMVGVAALRRELGEFEARLVRVNGQPGRVLRGPGEPPLTDAARLAAQRALAALRSGDVDLRDGNAEQPEPKAEWFERPFGDVDADQFALDLRERAPRPVRDWLERLPRREVSPPAGRTPSSTAGRSSSGSTSSSTGRPSAPHTGSEGSRPSPRPPDGRVDGSDLRVQLRDSGAV